VTDETVIASLQTVGLSQYEARVYVALLRNGTQNGNELARSSGVPSSKIYSTLEKLTGKGIVHATTRGSANAFAPVAPAELIDRLRGRFNDPLDLLADELPRLTRPEEAAPLLGVTGLAGVLETARAIIGGATTAIHASCWSADVEALREAFAAAEGRGVAVWGMLYGPADPPAGTWLRHSYEDIVERRVGGRMLTMVADGADVLVARLPLDAEATAVRTRSPVLTMIVDEYLHHDFVLQRAQINIGFDQWDRWWQADPGLRAAILGDALAERPEATDG
jgi:Cd2+/Zn2+-exporting ATPase